MFRRKPALPSGKVPGNDFVDTADRMGLKVGLITRVDEINMKADIKVITGGGERFEIELTQGMNGPRSFWGGVPEENSIVLLGYRRIHKQLSEAVILGYLPVGNKSGIRFDPWSPVAPGEVDPEDQADVDAVFGVTRRYKRLMLKKGDVGGMSAAGSELILSKDVTFSNRAGDCLELRDDERSFIVQSLHKFESQSGLKRISGPIRRSSFFLPDDIFTNTETRTLRDQLDNNSSPDTYFGRDELQEAGPGPIDGVTRFANSEGVVSARFNNFTQFPAITLSNGRRVHYVPTTRGANIDNIDTPTYGFVEDRLEMFHTTNLTQEVLEEIDGFSADRRTLYIERVMGTLVGNDMNTNNGQRQYAKILKPSLFADFAARSPGSFNLSEVNRSPTDTDLEKDTAAGAYMFRIRPPRSLGTQNFVAAVTKQGKLLLNVPASTVEDQPASNISAEMNLQGALKAFIGASTPDRVSAHITCEGGIHLNVGRDSAGNALTIRYSSGTKTIYEGNPNEGDVTRSAEIKGVDEKVVTGAVRTTVQGRMDTLVSGQVSTRCDNFAVNSFGGYTLNAGEKNEMISGKSQLQYALAVISTIVAGGEVKTILAGGQITTIAAGAMVTTVAAGATAFNNPAGAFAITVGAGAITATTGSGAVTLSTGAGALAITAGAGVVAITAGAALAMTSIGPTVITSPLIMLGGPTAVLGVVRGIPTYPPGVPTLDYVTGLPLLGALLVTSN